MRNSIAAYKESLSRITHEVLLDEEEDQLLEEEEEISPQNDDSSPVPSSRRISLMRKSSRFTPPPMGPPIANGTTDYATSLDQLAKYKEDIQKLQASEAEIKALSFNYAAMLREKEEQLSKLREENGSLRKNLDAKDAVACASREESPKTSPNSSHVIKGTGDRSSIRSQRNTIQGNSRSGNHLLKNSIPKQDGYTNGGMQPNTFNTGQQKDLKFTNSQGNEKEHKDLLEEVRSLAAVQSGHESEINQLRAQLDSERKNASNIMLKLQEEHQLNESSQRELRDLKIDKETMSSEMKELQKELNEKISELRRLQVELSRRDMEENPNESLQCLKSAMSALEEENATLKIEKNELEASLKLCMKNAPEKTGANDLDSLDRNSSKLSETIEEMSLSMRKLEETLQDTCKERDKALQELARLKQHLLDKELEDSDKMDEDSIIIEELRAAAEHQRAHISQLEKALKLEVAKVEEFKKLKSDDLQKSNEAIDGLRQKLANCMSTIDSKNVELQNLQTALGQYYAESEAKERLGRDLLVAREGSAKLSELLKAANQGLEASRREKEEIFTKLSQAESMLAEGKNSMKKLEEDNTKLRRALEQSMKELKQLSMDSDTHVDRRIVIKLLITYFQRNYSREVLDLMVRILGFSEEDKKRIGFAQHTAGKGVVRGVFGLPGRLVGGFLGGSSHETSSNASSANQSFADLWVDFLLKETEEREKRESEEAARMSSIQERSSSSTKATASEYGTRAPTTSFPAIHYPSNQISHVVPSKQNELFEHSDTEFATVPLNSSASPSSKNAFSRLPPGY